MGKRTGFTPVKEENTSGWICRTDSRHQIRQGYRSGEELLEKFVQTQWKLSSRSNAYEDRVAEFKSEDNSQRMFLNRGWKMTGTDPPNLQQKFLKGKNFEDKKLKSHVIKKILYARYAEDYSIMKKRQVIWRECMVDMIIYYIEHNLDYSRRMWII